MTGVREWMLEAELETARRENAELRAALEQWPGVGRALVRGQPVRNLDELIVATELALGKSWRSEVL